MIEQGKTVVDQSFQPSFQVAAIVLAAVYKTKAGDESRKFAKYTLKKYYTDADHRDAVTLSWDFMMAEVRVYLVKTLITQVSCLKLCRGTFADSW